MDSVGAVSRRKLSRGVIYSSRQGLMPFNLTPNEQKLVPVEDWRSYATALSSSHSYPYPSPVVSTYNWREVLEETGFRECGQARTGPLSVHLPIIWQEAQKAFSDPEVAGHIVSSLLPPDLNSIYSTVYHLLRPSLVSVGQSEPLRLSAVGSTRPGDLTDIFLLSSGYGVYPDLAVLALVVLHGPAAVERLAARAWTEDVQFTLEAADRYLTLEPSCDWDLVPLEVISAIVE